MICLIGRKLVLQHKLLANYVAVIQARQIDDELGFAFFKKEEDKIGNVYDLADQYK